MEIDTNVILAGYLATCIFVAVIVHSFRVFDFRALAAELDDDLRPMSFFERPDRGLIILAFGVLALILAAYVGWRLPADIQRFMAGEGLGFGFSDIATGPLARASQVTGAICFTLIALRLMRLSLILAFTLSMMALEHFAFTLRHTLLQRDNSSTRLA